MFNTQNSNIMKIKEKVKKVMDMESYNDRNGELRQSRDLIVETEEQYPKEIALSFSGANCKLLDVLNPGDIVEVTFDIKSVPSQTTEKYFTRLNAWKLDIIQSVVNTPETQTGAADPTPGVTTQGNVIIP